MARCCCMAAKQQHLVKKEYRRNPENFEERVFKALNTVVERAE